METCLDTRQIGVLISLGYFESYGGSKKLSDFSRIYYEGKNRLTKTLTEKSVVKRMALNREEEASMPDENLSVTQRLKAEQEYIGLCLTEDPEAPPYSYYVLDVDDKYGVKARLYSIRRGTTGMVRLRKDDFAGTPFTKGDCISLRSGDYRPRYSYVNGTRKATGERDYWVSYYVRCEDDPVQKA